MNEMSFHVISNIFCDFSLECDRLTKKFVFLSFFLFFFGGGAKCHTLNHHMKRKFCMDTFLSLET